MTAPLAMIADALIEFILSLLRDSDAAEEFLEEPEAALNAAGLSGVSAEAVRAVVPVVVDHPAVMAKPIMVGHGGGGMAYGAGAHYGSGGVGVHQSRVAEEIQRVVNNFHLDQRSTIVDQSVNQNIWADGDVTQHFDQAAVLAAGDNSIAAGEDVLLDYSTVDVEVGDIGIGNTENNNDISDSYIDSSTSENVDTNVIIEDSGNDESTDIDFSAEISESFQENVITEIDNQITETYIDNSGNVESPDAVVAEEYSSTTDATDDSTYSQVSTYSEGNDVSYDDVDYESEVADYNEL